MRKSNLFASIFIIAYIASTALQLMPPSPLRNALFGPIKPAILYSGLWQNFILFAPEPPKYNVAMTATITRLNGQKEFWHYQNQQQMNLLEIVTQARLRNFGNLYASCYPTLRPDLARYIARLHSDQQNQPQQVDFKWHWTKIPPPHLNSTQIVDSEQIPPASYTYAVKASDLQ